MKRYVLMLAAAVSVGLCANNALAQQRSLKIERAGFVRDTEGEWTYSRPTTQIVVDVTVRTESVKIGPYARFAQNYLGVIAPLSDKVFSEITDVKLSYFDTDTTGPLLVEELPKAVSNVVSLTKSESDFLRVSPDQTGNLEKSAEYMAQDAANTIYAIRKHRMELITGEAGENVFGAGLKTALDELDRLENEYLALFLGKTVIKKESYRYVVMPQKDKLAYVVCRFSDTKGVLPQSDLSGQPIVLDLKGEGVYDSLVPKYNIKDMTKATFEQICIADNVTCRVMSGINVLAEQTFPLFQFGDVYEIDANAFSIRKR